MKPATDYIRHAARLARKLQMDAAMGGTPQPDAEFYKALSKALDEIAAGLEQVSRVRVSRAVPLIQSQAELEGAVPRLRARAAAGRGHRGGQLPPVSPTGCTCCR